MTDRCHEGLCGPDDEHIPDCPWPRTLIGQMETLKAAGRQLGVDLAAPIKRIRDRTTKELRRVWKATDR